MSSEHKPLRIQRKRTKGFKLPPNTLCATRPGEFSNPFRVGGYFKIGGRFGTISMLYTEACSKEYADETYTHIETSEQAVAMFREYRRKHPFTPEQIAKLRAADYVACFCPLDQPCHADVLLEIANSKEQ